MCKECEKAKTMRQRAHHTRDMAELVSNHIASVPDSSYDDDQDAWDEFWSVLERRMSRLMAATHALYLHADTLDTVSDLPVAVVDAPAYT